MPNISDASIFLKQSDFDTAVANGYLPRIDKHYWQVTRL